MAFVIEDDVGVVPDAREGTMPGISDRTYRFLQKPFARLWRTRLLDTKNIPARGPVVFVANHLGSYAPIAVLAAFPRRLYPWVQHDVTERKVCPGYLRLDFIEPELRLQPPLSRAAAWLISKPCLAVMKALGAVPVYPRSPRLSITWERSLEVLRKEEALVIFPENKDRPSNGVVNGFDGGFVDLGSFFFKDTGRTLDFIPVAVHKEAKAIRVGRPIPYIPAHPLSFERRRIVTALQDEITKMVLATAA